MDVHRWFARVLGDCFKRRHEETVDWEQYVGKEGTTRMVLTPVPYIDISPVHLQPCAPSNTPIASSDDTTDAQDPLQWTETNRLANAAAAWQIRRLMPVDVATMDEAELVKMTTLELAWRFKALPVLMLLRASNDMLRKIPLDWLSTEAFARLELIERRAVHNVLAERPSGWSENHLSLYAARERELIEAANEDQSGKWSYDALYAIQLPFVHSAYAQEPRGWEE